MTRASIVLLVTLLTVLAAAKDDFILKDLIAEETSAVDNRRVIHNIGDDESNRSLSNVQRTTRTRKTTRQSPEDIIRDIRKITGGHITQGKSYKNEAPTIQDVKVKDKGGGNKDDDDDEDKKTLAQQVVDGKYGLIQTELFDPPAVRPGILSYEVNPEVPKDNINNLGGLQPEEIWLAENHLLVLSGGGYPEKHKSDKLVWPPIDNYVAPMRQVKIPPNPKVPPPFPVQLKPGGPTEFIKNENGTGGPPPFPPFFAPPFLSNSSEGYPPFLPDNNNFPYPPPDYVPGNFSQGNGPFYPPPPFPFFPPPPGNQNGTFFVPPPGFFPGIPPGAAFLPPPGNFTDQYDEDDPSIYYPPPYDFYYPKDNSSLVPPGPLVPGIVLPPPPDFFAPLTNKTTSKSRRPPGTRYQTKIKPSGPTRKPGKTKTNYISTTIKQFEDQSTPDYYDTLDQVTTPPPVYYSTEVPATNKPEHTFRPTDNSLNEITPPTLHHVLPPNAVVQGWVPIPAPKPFFITGPRKPLQKFSTTTTLPPDYNSVTPPPDQNGYVYNVPQHQYQLPENGWVYPNNSQLYNKQQYFDYFDYYPENKKEQYFSSTSPPVPYKQDKLRTILIQHSKEILASTAPPAQAEPRGKSLKATYYFYEEPHISQAHIQDADDFRVEDAIYSTPAPPRQFYETNTRKPKISNYEINGKFQPSPIDYFFAKDLYAPVNPSTTTQSPFRYYYVPQGPLQYPARVPDKSFKGSSTTTTTKPPVYEYSYSAPGYGSIEPPKIGITPKPINQLYNSPQYDHQYYDYDTTPKAPKQNGYNFNNPTLEPNLRQFFTTARPDYNTRIENNSDKEVDYYDSTRLGENRPNPIHQTENPYHAFFTHHDAGLIDDITKKYFTTFGQKINKESIRGEPVTTPLPTPLEADVARKAVYPITTPRPRNQIKFPDEQYYNAYFTTPAPSRNGNIQEALYSKVQPQYNRQIYNYNARPAGLVSPQKPISLEKDTLVNYRQPLPAVNPDAEFIDTTNPGVTKPQQSLIQYRLPGDGDSQFYFYTPQAVQPQNYQQNNNGYYFPTGVEQNGGYYKRNARRQQPQRRKQAEA